MERERILQPKDPKDKGPKEDLGIRMTRGIGILFETFAWLAVTFLSGASMLAMFASPGDGPPIPALLAATVIPYCFARSIQQLRRM
jgi:hypothetical protein